MNSTNIVKLLEKLEFDPAPYLKRCKEIGDVAAYREIKGIRYRRNYERGLLVLALAHRFNLKQFLEFGTGRGYVCGVLEDMANLDRIVTIDINSVKLAKKILEPVIDVSNVEFLEKDTLSLRGDDVNGKFDFCFVDALHTGEAVQNDYMYFLSKAEDRYVVVFDDYRKLFPDVKETINRIAASQQFDNMFLVHTDGWLIKNKMIKQAPDADKVVDGKELKSGMVVGIKGYEL